MACMVSNGWLYAPFYMYTFYININNLPFMQYVLHASCCTFLMRLCFVG